MLLACAEVGPGSLSSRPLPIVNGKLYPNHPEIVYIEVPNGSEPNKKCTGTFVGRNLVLTARHCVGQFFTVPIPLPWTSPINIYNGDQAGTGTLFKVSTKSQVHVLPEQPGQEPEDIALLETDTAYTGSPLGIATGNDLPTPSNISSFANKRARLAGFSPNDLGGDAGPPPTNPLKKRMTGEMTISGSSGSGGKEFYLNPYNQQILFGGDSGGPVIYRGKVVGVISGIGYACTDEERMNEPWKCKGRAAYINLSLFQGVDSDVDGIRDAQDICPTTPDTDQKNCDDVDEAQGQKKGDACDPDPCVYLTDVVPTTGVSYSGGVKWYSTEARIQYRGVGYDVEAAQDYLNKDMDGYYCACHIINGKDPHAPDKYSESDCKTLICPNTTSPAGRDPEKDTGWLEAIWGVHDDAYNYSATGFQWCPAGNNDTEGQNNDCLQPLPSRLYRKPFADMPGGGGQANDWEQYWGDASKARTRSFRWDWRKQDYPHDSSLTGPYQPYIYGARVRVWLRKEGHQYYAANANGFSEVMNLECTGKAIMQALRNLFAFERLYMPGPVTMVNPFAASPVAGPLMIHPLAMERPFEDEVAPYLWPSLPEDAATKGMIIKRFNYDSGDFGDYTRSEIVEGRPPFTRAPAMARWAADDEVYLFGGHTMSGDRPPVMWHGVPHQQGEELVYQWRELPGPHPDGRTGAILVQDPERERLLLMYGETAAGTTDEVFAFDRASGTWATVAADIPELGPISHTGHSVSGQTLYVYGGKQADVARDGMWAIDLSTLTGTRLDQNAEGGPGPRSGAAVYYEPNGRSLYVFGGEDNGMPHNDLWQLDLKRGVWALVSPDWAPGAPVPMSGAAMVVSPGDGSISVLAGPLMEPAEPMWQLRLGSWHTWEQLLVPKED